MVILVQKSLCLATFAFFAVLLNAPAQLAYFPQTGHWYEPVKVSQGITWNDAYTNAIHRGGYLCTVTNASENTFVASLVDSSYYSDVSINGDILGPWLGGFRRGGESTWQWITGEPFTYFNWYPNQPDGYGGSDQRLQYYANASVGSSWGDHPGDSIPGYSLPRGYIVEYNTPKLEIISSNNVSVLSWPQVTNTWVLEKSINLSGTTIWTPISTNQFQAIPLISIAVTNTESKAFFRLRMN